MLSDLILNLFIAHIFGDFYLQTESMCKNKVSHSIKGLSLYAHSLIVAVVSWLLVWDWNAWWLVLIILLSHWLIDWSKSALQKKWKILKVEDDGESIVEENSQYGIWFFLADQILHIGVIVIGAYFWMSINGYWEQFGWITDLFATHPLRMRTGIAMLLVLKPVNILLVLILKAYKVNVPALSDSQSSHKLGNNSESDGNKDQNEHGNFHSGALIGALERGLMLVFVVMSQYEAIGFLVAAKSILRFSQVSSEDEKSEYVLAGTFLSLSFALGLGLLVLKL